MKLVARVTVTLFVLITLSSAAIGYFAISRYEASQINQIDQSLNSKVKSLKSSKEDPLTVAQYLAQVSAIPVTVAYVEQTGTQEVLSETGPNIPAQLNATLVKSALKRSISYDSNLLIRTFALPRDEKVVFAESTQTINSDVSALRKDLIIFIVLVDLLALMISYFVFRRDGKLNELSRLVAEQKAAMQRFIGDASHELRTPLTVIKGYVELAQSTDDDERQSAYLERSSTEIKRMERIIGDLLFLAEVGESQEIVEQEIDLTALLKDEVEILRALQPRRTIQVETDGPIVVKADQKLLERMLGNIFSNIRRHTPDEAPVKVSLKKSGQHLTLTVEDGGPGLSDYPTKHRLKRFSQSRSKEGGGSGLGLSIVGGVVEHYGADLALSKGSLGGLSIQIKFPRRFFSEMDI